MSWYQSLFDLTKRVVGLDSRVTKNEKEIEALRRDLQKLTGFTRNVAAAVQRNQENSAHAHKQLLLELENQLLRLRLELTVVQTGQVSHNGSVAPTKALSGKIEPPFE